MKKVYYKNVSSYANTDVVNLSAAEILKYLLDKENITLESRVPLKVHFGEKGNTTFIEPKNYDGIISYLKELDVDSEFIETNVLYRGERVNKEKHLALAREHGFVQLPIKIADGDLGEQFEEVQIAKKHYKYCKIARDIASQKQMILLNHFKGHVLAGFGGAVKQLAMGCASRSGKLEMHSQSIPRINRFKCTGCKACAEVCPQSAVAVKNKARIDKDRCIGCTSCLGTCPSAAITNGWLASLGGSFKERLAEYAYAAAKDKDFIYINFALNITKTCDCHGFSTKRVSEDIGIFASLDPVAVDQACLDMLEKINAKKMFRRGRHTLKYAEEIGLGNRRYELVPIV
jgi:uncharacterized Fe-S center protein